ncbi:MAG: hypothetical protein MUC71_09695 [Steroidobacteraceae bacterium]|jgi:hypothetical protein|nr:hypothetical protein [Steroidobacteraceae bacterium]
MLALLKIALTVLLVGMFGYAIVALGSGRVYCKGRWYERDATPGGFWATIVLYIAGPPVILYLLWTAQ